MNELLLNLYKVTWKHTANTYIVSWTKDLQVILDTLRKKDDRCDDIVSIEKVLLRAFDDKEPSDEYIHLFWDVNVL